jgi:hypothetical protein
MWVGFSLDGQSGQRTSYVGITSSLPDGVNVLDHLYNVPAGNHTLALWGHTTGQPISLQRIDIQFVSYPVFIATGKQVVNMPIVVDSSTGQAQPCWAGDASGKWTKLLEFTVPTYSGFAPNYLLDGYIQFTGDRQGTPRAQVGIEAITGTNGQCSGNSHTDFGIVTIMVPPVAGGVYPFGEALGWGDTAGQVIRLWIRPYGGGGGTFTVLNRYLGAKLLAANTCYFP